MKKQKLIIEQLDQKISEFVDLKDFIIPRRMFNEVWEWAG